jgi:phosphoribosylformylglycinamidine cyclo-ligase
MPGQGEGAVDGDRPGLTYSQAGVDIDRANQAKRRIKELARSTFNASVLGEIGGFAGVYRPDFSRFRRPVLLSSADGVGTKLKIAFMTGIHNTVGVDLVAHCTNDILVLGAQPLFFLDYIAAGTLDPTVVERVVEGLAAGCRESECVLLGGETAEMPDFYGAGEYDLAGFIVGMADEGRLLGPRRVGNGDLLIGLPSSGLHTNGYSLVRRLFFDRERLSVDTRIEEFGRTVGEELLEPHRNYLPVIKDLIAEGRVNAIAHITGGGITENLDRVLPADLDAAVERGSWEIPPVFRFIRDRGRIDDGEMYRTFNMGIGMILVVSDAHADGVGDFLSGRAERFVEIGEIRAGSGRVVYR